MPNSNLFQNRSGTNLNRRKLTIVSQTANEMIVDVERADNVQAGNEGTPLNATTFNDINSRIEILENQSFPSTDPNSNNNIFDLIYPVGSIYFSVNSTNPGTIFHGTWVAWGAGRVPVGIGNNGETNYTIAEATGGSENSVAQHTHTQNAHSHQVLTVNTWSSNAVGLKDSVTGEGAYTTKGIAGVEQSGGNTGYRNISASSEQYIHNTTPTNNNEGIVGGNRQPYITCYIWKRVS